jgi:hypothetical protein
MFIDYIYLLLIIFIICCIIYTIYLSYEYRTIENFIVKSATILPLPTFSKIVFNRTGEVYSFDQSYYNANNEIVNRSINKDNLKQLDLYKKLNTNLASSQELQKLSTQNIVKPPTFPIDKLIKTIKSKYNAQYISTTANNMKNYGILINDKCLTVNGLCKDDFCLLNCQNNLYSTDSQKFKTQRITSDNDAATAMNVSIDKISKKNIYPFNIFRSLVNDNCLTISNDGITVENCNLNNIQQQWEISPNENICVLK